MNSKYLYLALNLLTVSIPLAASFYSKAPFYKTWRSLWIAILISAIPFLVWDELFTRMGVWGFNAEYLTGFFAGSLPLEEILFFICIPYACVFVYFALKHFFERDPLWAVHEIITSILVVALLIGGMYHVDKAYTGTTFLLLACFLAYEMLKRRVRYTGYFYVSFAVILIPFFIVNGVLTGTFISGEVVWYDNSETLGIRIGTVPVEDIFYAMLLLIVNISVYETFESWFARRRKKSSPL